MIRDPHSNERVDRFKGKEVQGYPQYLNGQRPWKFVERKKWPFNLSIIFSRNQHVGTVQDSSGEQEGGRHKK